MKHKFIEPKRKHHLGFKQTPTEPAYIGINSALRTKINLENEFF